MYKMEIIIVYTYTKQTKAGSAEHKAGGGAGEGGEEKRAEPGCRRLCLLVFPPWVSRQRGVSYSGP